MLDLPLSPKTPYRTFAGARPGLPAAASDRLVTLPGFPFPVAASRNERAAARRIARRARSARDLLHSVLGVAPHLALRVLDRADWHRYADVSTYSVTHVADSGELVVGADAADAWHGISDAFARRLPAADLSRLVAVHGVDAVNRRGPALGALAETLIVHEVAHVLAAQEALSFPTRWLEEAFANYALVAVLGESDPGGLRLVGSLAEAAATLRGSLPRLSEFEREFGQMDVVQSVLAELEITRGVYAAYASQRTAPLVRLFAAFRAGSRPRDADYELGRMLATRVHPAIAAIPARFGSERIGLGA